MKVGSAHWLLLGILLLSPVLIGAMQIPSTVWYLGHSGYAVRVENRLLVFDYTQNQGSPSASPGAGGLADGLIDGSDLEGLEVFVFVTHSHGDHFDRVIHSWASGVGEVHYFFGWAAGSDSGHHSLVGPRATAAVDGVRVWTVNSNPDGVPEVAFLVEVGGLWIYHNGDHYTPDVDDLEYLSSVTPRVDVAFLPGVARYRNSWVEKGISFIERMNPGIVFPMHLANREEGFREWAAIVNREGFTPEIRFPRARGDRFEIGPGG